MWRAHRSEALNGSSQQPPSQGVNNRADGCMTPGSGVSNGVSGIPGDLPEYVTLPSYAGLCEDGRSISLAARGTKMNDLNKQIVEIKEPEVKKTSIAEANINIVETKVQLNIPDIQDKDSKDFDLTFPSDNSRSAANVQNSLGVKTVQEYDKFIDSSNQLEVKKSRSKGDELDFWSSINIEDTDKKYLSLPETKNVTDSLVTISRSENYLQNSVVSKITNTAVSCSGILTNKQGKSLVNDCTIKSTVKMKSKGSKNAGKQSGSQKKAPATKGKLKVKLNSDQKPKPRWKILLALKRRNMRAKYRERRRIIRKEQKEHNKLLRMNKRANFENQETNLVLDQMNFPMPGTSKCNQENLPERPLSREIVYEDLRNFLTSQTDWPESEGCQIDQKNQMCQDQPMIQEDEPQYQENQSRNRRYQSNKGFSTFKCSSSEAETHSSHFPNSSRTLTRSEKRKMKRMSFQSRNQGYQSDTEYLSLDPLTSGAGVQLSDSPKASRILSRSPERRMRLSAENQDDRYQESQFLDQPNRHRIEEEERQSKKPRYQSSTDFSSFIPSTSGRGARFSDSPNSSRTFSRSQERHTRLPTDIYEERIQYEGSQSWDQSDRQRIEEELQYEESQSGNQGYLSNTRFCTLGRDVRFSDSLNSSRTLSRSQERHMGLPEIQDDRSQYQGNQSWGQSDRHSIQEEELQYQENQSGHQDYQSNTRFSFMPSTSRRDSKFSDSSSNLKTLSKSQRRKLRRMSSTVDIKGNRSRYQGNQSWDQPDKQRIKEELQYEENQSRNQEYQSNAGRTSSSGRDYRFSNSPNSSRTFSRSQESCMGLTEIPDDRSQYLRNLELQDLKRMNEDEFQYLKSQLWNQGSEIQGDNSLYQSNRETQRNFEEDVSQYQGNRSEHEQIVSIQEDFQHLPSTSRGNVLFSSTTTPETSSRFQNQKVSDKESSSRNSVSNNKKYGTLEEFLQSNHLMRAIVVDGFRKLGINKKEFSLVKFAISQKIDQIRDGRIPRFNGAFIQFGSIVVESADLWSREWLTNIVPTLYPWTGARLKVVELSNVEKYQRANLWIPGLGETSDMILRRIEKQNPTLNTGIWRVYSEKQWKKPKGCNLILGVPNSSITALKELNFRPFFGLDRVHVNVRGEKDPNDAS